jgi:hypothetical protein
MASSRRTTGQLALLENLHSAVIAQFRDQPPHDPAHSFIGQQTPGFSIAMLQE